MVEVRGGVQAVGARDGERVEMRDQPPDLSPAPAPGSLPPGATAYAIAAGITVAALLRRGAFYWPDHAILPAFLAVLALVAVRRIDPPVRAVVVALCAFAAWWTIAAVGWGIPAQALPLLGSMIGFGAALLLGQALPEEHRPLVHRALVLVGVGIAALGLVGLVLRSYPLAMDHEHLWRLASTLTYANAAGVLLAMLVSVVATAPISPAARRTALFLVLTGIAATLSRGAVLALVVSIPFLPRPALRAAAWPALLAAGAGAVVLARADELGAQPILALVLLAGTVASLRPPSAVFTPRSPLTLAVAALVLGLIAAAAFAPAVSRRAGGGTLGDRGETWPAAARAFAEHPVIGEGPEHDFLLPGDLSVRISRFAHNEYLQVAAGAGLVGLALLGLVIATIIGAVRGPDPASAAARAALAVLAVGAVVDFAWHLPAVGITAGWIASLSGRRS